MLTTCPDDAGYLSGRRVRAEGGRLVDVSGCPRCSAAYNLQGERVGRVAEDPSRLVKDDLTPRRRDG